MNAPPEMRNSAAATAPVSVVIPFYGGHETIQRAVASLNDQTLRPAEIVIVDDASAEPLRPEAIRSSVPVRTVSHERNRGIPAARNAGIRAAAHEWLGFLDQDDEWASDKLGRQWALAERAGPNEDLVVFGRLLMETGEAEPYLIPPSRAIPAIEAGGSRAARAFLRHGNVLPFVTLLVPRPVFDRYGLLDESLRGGGDDTELVLRLIGEGVRFRFDDDPGARRWSAAHRFTGRNYSAHAPRWIADQVALFPRLAEAYPVLEPLRDRYLARARYALGRHHDRSGDAEAAAAEYHRAIRLDPFWWRPWAARLRLAAPATARRAVAVAWRWLKERRRERGSSGRE